MFLFIRWAFFFRIQRIVKLGDNLWKQIEWYTPNKLNRTPSKFLFYPKLIFSYPNFVIPQVKQYCKKLNMIYFETLISK